jgi:hypothetical protein
MSQQTPRVIAQTRSLVIEQTAFGVSCTIRLQNGQVAAYGFANAGTIGVNLATREAIVKAMAQV